MSRFKVGMRFDIDTNTIKSSERIIRTITNMVFALQSEHLFKMHARLYKWAYRWTMVASGETRSKLYNVSRRVSKQYTMFETGYMPTTNNQSVAQEFDLGPVHKRLEEHMYAKGAPKCSTRPVDIHLLFGGYQVNPSARRRALANAVAFVYRSPVRFAVKEAGKLRYQPNLDPTIRHLKTLTAAVTNRV